MTEPDQATPTTCGSVTAEGAVTEGHVKAWSLLRNKTAHANTKAAGSTQDLVKLCDVVTVLLYHLIFKAIGYEGHYTDYSEYGYPPRRYRGRPVTEDEIAVAAYFLWKADGEKHGNDLAHWFKGRAMLESGLI